ncbi:MAG: Lsr2 family protein, partial [Streptomyces sp.]|nr:Lsr2 family protein [Streptomyces sp.]
MAQKNVVMLIDDLDGGDADETVSFSLDGVSYEIDLNAGNAAKMREALAP